MNDLFADRRLVAKLQCMEVDDGKGFTPGNLLGGAVGCILFILVFAMIGMAAGLSCKPDMPCWTDNRQDLLIAFAVAVLFGLIGGWGTAKLIRWVVNRFRS